MTRPEDLLPWGLLAAWLVNDAEEWVTMAPWSARNADRIAALPIRVPWPEDGMSARQAHVAIGLVGAGIAAAAVAGAATGRRSRFYRSTLLAFGLHGFTHIAQSVALRRYTPGVVTGATVVVPFWLWAETVRRGIGDAPYSRGEILGALASLASLPAVVAVAGRIAAAVDAVPGPPDLT